ncbi:MAG: acyl--CoA ligase [bacterium]|nr:acyl--CoA ligase [bacterium]
MHSFFHITASHYPEKIAVYEGNRGYTYAELAARTHRIAAALQAISLLERDRVVIAFDNVIEFILAYFGVLTAGSIPVLIPTDMPSAKIAAVIDDVAAAGIIGHAQVFSALPARPPYLRFSFLDGSLPEVLSDIPVYRSIKDLASLPDGRKMGAGVKPPGTEFDCDPQTIIFTSGTSGPPKGVVLSAANLNYSTGVMVDYLHLTPDDRSLVSIPFSHCAGLLHMLAHIRCAGSLVTGESPALPGSFLKAVLRRQVTGLPAVPSLMRLFVSNYKQGVAEYCSRLRYMELSSEPCEGSLLKVCMDLLPEVSFFNTYGLTEAPRTTYHDIREQMKDVTSVGRPNPGVGVRIVNSRNNPCVPGEIGEIHISGLNVAAGYWQRPEKAAAAFTPRGFKTGDLACRDVEGRIYLKGRIDKRVKISGQWVSPEEVELVIATLPGILKAEVLCQDDPTSGIILCARIMTHSAAVNEKQVLQTCRTHLEKYKIPTKIIFTGAAEESTEAVAI